MSTLVAVVQTVLWALVVTIIVPVSVFAIQIFAGTFRSRLIFSGNVPETGSVEDIGIIVPAHNEVDVICRTLDSLLLQVEFPEQILVVADNCTDDTASVARSRGVAVAERHDPSKRGKGYALSFGVEYFGRKEKPPSVVIIVDADCWLAPNAVKLLVSKCREFDGPVQGRYLMLAPSRARVTRNRRENISLFAWRVKNWLRPSGARRLGWPCQLTGSGMAFPWRLIFCADLAHGNIVEDLKLGLDLALSGNFPTFCEEAVVFSELPQDRQNADLQRRRWEKGHLQTIISYVPRLVSKAISTGSWKLLGQALDLLVPPLAILLLSTIVSLALAFFIQVSMGGVNYQFIILAGLFLVFIVCIFAAWCRVGRGVVGFVDISGLPSYILVKIFLILVGGRKKSDGWNKTKRD